MQYFLNAWIEDLTVISQWSIIWKFWINWAKFFHRAKSSQQLEQSVYKIWIELFEGRGRWEVGLGAGSSIFGEGFSSYFSLLPVQPSPCEISPSQQYWRFFFFFSSIFETDLINFSFPQFPGSIKFIMYLSIIIIPTWGVRSSEAL